MLGILCLQPSFLLSFKYWAFVTRAGEGKYIHKRRNMTRSKHKVTQESEKRISCSQGGLPRGGEALRLVLRNCWSLTSGPESRGLPRMGK